jgi:hypothetical protein
MSSIKIFVASLFLFSSVSHANSQEMPNLVEEIQAQLESPIYTVAQGQSKKKRSRRRTRAKTDLLAKAKKLAIAKEYEKSSQLLFSLTRSSRYKKDASQIKYILGLMLMEMGLYQVASFVFYDVISGEIRTGRTSKYLRQSLSKVVFLE